MNRILKKAIAGAFTLLPLLAAGGGSAGVSAGGVGPAGGTSTTLADIRQSLLAQARQQQLPRHQRPQQTPAGCLQERWQLTGRPPSCEQTHQRQP